MDPNLIKVELERIIKRKETPNQRDNAPIANALQDLAKVQAIELALKYGYSLKDKE